MRLEMPGIARGKYHMSEDAKISEWNISQSDRSEAVKHYGLKQLYWCYQLQHKGNCGLAVRKPCCEAHVGPPRLSMPMAKASSVTLGHRRVRTCYYAGITLFSKLRRENFELIKKERTMFWNPLGDSISDCA